MSLFAFDELAQGAGMRYETGGDRLRFDHQVAEELRRIGGMGVDRSQQALKLS